MLPGFKVYESVANFILIKYPIALKEALQKAFAEQSYKVKFMNDPSIPVKEVAVTCENCGMKDCAERVAEPIRFEKDIRNKRLNVTINDFIKEQSK